MPNYVLLLMVALASPAFSQNDFSTWEEKCSDFNNLINQKERDFCTGFNFAIQNMPASFPMILPGRGNIIARDIMIADPEGQLLNDAPESGALMTFPDAEAMIANPPAMELLNNGAGTFMMP